MQTYLLVKADGKVESVESFVRQLAPDQMAVFDFSEPSPGSRRFGMVGGTGLEPVTSCV